MAVTPKKFASGFEFAEGPAFDREGNLYVVNIQGGYIAKISPRGKVSRFCETGGGPNGAKFHADGDLYVCDAKLRAILCVSPNGMFTKVVTECDGNPLLGPNDLVFAADGGYYFSDPLGSSVQNPIGAVYRVDPKSRVTRFASGFAFPNGVALSPDEKRLYLAESRTRRIHSFALRADGMPAAARVHAELPPGGDGPDGMAFDVEGNLYVAYYGMGKIYVIDQWGRITKELPAGGPNPTNVAFGGKGRKTLYITEAKTNCVYTIKNDIPGWPLFAER